MLNINLEDKLFTFLITGLLSVVYGLIMLSFFLGLKGDLHYNNIGSLTLPSLFFFVTLLMIILVRKNLFFFFLPFIILSFPSPIDDIFPSVRLTNVDDAGFTVFPLITRIDIYLLLGIFIKTKNRAFKLKFIKIDLLLKLFLFLFLLVFIVNIFKSEDFLDYNLLLAHTFHIRYFILLLILFSFVEIRYYENVIVYGLIFSLMFLLCESYFNTKLKGLDRLSSGSLSLNTFANISAAHGLFFYYLIRNSKISINKLLLAIGILISFLIVLGSGTRGAFLALALSILYIYILNRPKKIVFNIIKAFFISIMFFSTYIYLSYSKTIPNRYSYEYLVNRVNIDLSASGLKNIIQIKESWETSSLKTRLNLFETSLNMISSNPVTGIGVGRWNRYKNEYNKDKSINKVLLDTHNDYLALLSQYGIILGLLIAYMIFYYPRKLIKSTLKSRKGVYQYFSIFGIFMGFAAFSNSGFFKHQVAAFLLLCFVICYNMFKNCDTINQ